MRTALVTGATSRLGAPLARAFAAENYRVILHVHSAQGVARSLADELGGAEILAADFAERPDIERFCDELIERFGAPDVIVNNASVFRHDFPGAADAGRLVESLSVHAVAPFMILEAVARAKKPDAQLTVFNILDQKLLNLNPDYYSYTLGKAALMALTQLWQKAERPDVRVFGLAPGLMFPSGPQTEARFHADVARIPTGQALATQDICALIRFVLGNRDLPGMILPLDGGEHLLGRRRDIAFE